MHGREDKTANDLFYTCSLIEYIGRKTKNRRKDVVDALGYDTIDKIFHLADVYHSDNIDRVSDDLIEEAGIKEGNFDNVADCRFAVPSHWDIGKVYKRLVLKIAQTEQIEVTEAIFKAYHSFVCDLIDDYNSSFYYEIPDNIFNAYVDGKLSE